MIIIGLTGGTGSGKSTAATIMKNHGVMIIDADVIAREVVEKGSDALKEITECFGEKILQSDGSLNRKKLGSIVFADEEKLKKLNQITHKYIINEIRNRIDYYKINNENSIVVIDAALLIELKLYLMCDYVCLICAEKSVRIERIKIREGISYEDINNRINCQLTYEETKKYADYIIANNGNMKDLELKIKKMLNKIESS